MMAAAPKSRRGFGIGIDWSVLIIVIAVLMQGTLLARIRILGVSPNLVLTLVVCWSLLRGTTAGVLWGFVGGLGIDLIAGLPVGASALALMPTSFLAGLGRYRIFAGHILLPALLVALATPLHGWLVLLTEQIRGVPVDWLAATLRVVLPEMALNAALTFAVHPVLRWVTLLTGSSEQRR